MTKAIMAAWLALWVLGAPSYAAEVRVHWTQTGCPIVAEWAVLCSPSGGTTPDDLGRIGNTAPTPDTCDLTVDVDAGDRAGSWVCWMHAIRIETGEVSPASNTVTVSFGTTSTTTTSVVTTSTSGTTTTQPGTPACGPQESACERGVVSFCLCGGVDPCLAGEWCAGAARLCPTSEAACRALLPVTTTTSSTSTTSSTAPTSTTTSTTLRFEFRAPVVIEIHPL